MAFTKIEKLQAGRPGGVNGTSPDVAIARYGKGTTSLHFHARLATELGWKPKDKVAIAEGTGPDAGWLCITRDPSGFSLTHEGTKYKGLRVGCSRLLPHIQKLPKTKCHYEIGNGALYIRIPERLMTADAAKPAASNGTYAHRVAAE